MALTCLLKFSDESKITPRLVTRSSFDDIEPNWPAKVSDKGEPTISVLY